MGCAAPRVGNVSGSTRTNRWRPDAMCVVCVARSGATTGLTPSLTPQWIDPLNQHDEQTVSMDLYGGAARHVPQWLVAKSQTFCRSRPLLASNGGNGVINRRKSQLRVAVWYPWKDSASKTASRVGLGVHRLQGGGFVVTRTYIAVSFVVLRKGLDSNTFDSTTFAIPTSRC